MENTNEESKIVYHPENELDIKRFGHTMTLSNIIII